MAAAKVTSAQEDKCGIGAKSWACEQELEGHLQAGQPVLATWYTGTAEEKCMSKVSGPGKHGLHKFLPSLLVDAGNGRLACQGAAAHICCGGHAGAVRAAGYTPAGTGRPHHTCRSRHAGCAGLPHHQGSARQARSLKADELIEVVQVSHTKHDGGHQNSLSEADSLQAIEAEMSNHV